MFFEFSLQYVPLVTKQRGGTSLMQSFNSMNLLTLKEYQFMYIDDDMDTHSQLMSKVIGTNEPLTNYINSL